MKKIFYVISFFLAMSIFASIMPYPVFSNFTNINETNAYEINNHYESELRSKMNLEQQIIPLDFNAVSPIIDGEFQVYDLKTEISFTAKRTGGELHMDIEPINEKNAKLLKEICGEDPTLERRPILIKISEYAFIPASMTAYPHGYTKISNGLLGHICVHFKGSKMDGTNQEDSKHQKAVDEAQKYGREFLKQLD